MIDCASTCYVGEVNPSTCIERYLCHTITNCTLRSGKDLISVLIAIVTIAGCIRLIFRLVVEFALRSNIADIIESMASRHAR